MEKILVWIYVLNLSFLINHEIDSAYWNEWKLFRMKGGAGGFVLLHFPMWFLFLYGLVEMTRLTTIGLVISFVLGFSGTAAFFIHQYFIRKGRTEFTTLASRIVLTGGLLVSIVEITLTSYFCYF